jgi:RNase P subunit RPR2
MELVVFKCRECQTHLLEVFGQVRLAREMRINVLCPKCDDNSYLDELNVNKKFELFVKENYNGRA